MSTFTCTSHLHIDRKRRAMQPGAFDWIEFLIDLDSLFPTDRQITILNLVMEGYSYRQIGNLLGIHNSMVGKEIKSIRNKVKSNNVTIGF